jgi:beta-lactamase class A
MATKPTPMKQKLSFEPRWFAVIVFFVSGVFIGAFILFIWIFNGGSFYGIQKIHSAIGGYKFINPLIAVDREQITDFFANQSLQSKLQAIIDVHTKNNDIKQASVYFRDLDPGRWVGINEDLKFSAGRLLKVPIMIAYFKLAEADPAILQKNLVYTQNQANAAEDSRTALEDGKDYTVEELIEDMIINDTDDAANVLYDNIDKPALNEVFGDLGIEFKEDKATDDYISVKLYSLFFRVLYNATYLDRTYSEKALYILSQTPNTDGIALGLPNDVVFSNKDRTRDFSKSLKEGHDCGIVYYPNHPYLLCTMAIGRSGETIKNIFKELSQVVYKDMMTNYKN